MRKAVRQWRCIKLDNRVDGIASGMALSNERQHHERPLPSCGDGSACFVDKPGTEDGHTGERTILCSAVYSRWCVVRGRMDATNQPRGALRIVVSTWEWTGSAEGSGATCQR